MERVVRPVSHETASMEQEFRIFECLPDRIHPGRVNSPMLHREILASGEKKRSRNIN